MQQGFKRALVVVFLALLVAYVEHYPVLEYIQKWSSGIILKDDARQIQVANAWDKFLGKERDHIPYFKRIAVGVNADVDVIVDGIVLMKQLVENHEDAILPQDHATLTSLSNLLEIFSKFHSKGAGGERFMSNETLFKEIVKIAQKLDKSELSVGGNGALIAQKLASITDGEFTVMFGGDVGPALKPLLHSSIMIPKSSIKPNDEFHLILEYAKHSKWNNAVAPIASRFIFSNDITNGQVLAFENFIKSIDQINPDLIVLSGLHLLEGQGPALWNKRLNEISRSLQKLSNKVPIHLELASMFNMEYAKQLSYQVFPLVHSIGLNEQELWVLCRSHHGPHCEREKPSGPPRIAVTNDIVNWMLLKFSDRKSSRLSRIHFHTLTHHTVAVLRDSKWKNADKSVAAGARVASLQACDYDQVDVQKSDLFIDGLVPLTAGEIDMLPHSYFNPHEPILSVTTGQIALYTTPVIVCKVPVKTVGLGDAITALGLFYSKYI